MGRAKNKKDEEAEEELETEFIEFPITYSLEFLFDMLEEQNYSKITKIYPKGRRVIVKYK